MECLIKFLPSGASVKALPGETILDVARRADFSIDSPCGGHGTCGKCHVRVQQTDGTWLTVPACRTAADRSMTVVLPQTSDQTAVILTGGQNRQAEVLPHWEAVFVTLAQTSQERPKALWDRLTDALYGLKGAGKQAHTEGED